MNKYIATLLFFGAIASGTHAAAQTASPAGSSPLRTEFISYDGARPDIEKNIYKNSKYYKELKFNPSGDTHVAEIEIPVLWLDREFFLHTEGIEHSEITVNGHPVETHHMHMLPYEINISPYITDGMNRIVFRTAAETAVMPQRQTPQYGRLAYVYSQPKLRIEDFMITAEPDSLNKYGILTIRLALANSYNFPEEIKVAYDIYDPKGELKYFDNRYVTVQGALTGGRDTLEFKEFIYGTPANLWTAEKPVLYHGMLIVTFERRIVEYIPYSVGFGKTEVIDGKLVRNGKPIAVKAARYNAAQDRKTTADELSRLRKAGINTIMVGYPQPYWFYELTDQTGMYVFDQPGLEFGENPDRQRTPNASTANDPRLAPSYLHLTQAMFNRSRNHTSIAGWSLGGDHGNGYNLYQTYRWLKQNETVRPVIYNGADGEWNSDMEPIPSVDAREILTKSAPAQNTRNRR